MFGKKWVYGALLFAAAMAVAFGLQAGPVHAAPAKQADAISIVKAYYDAYNAGDIDKAVSYLADDVVFVNPTGTYTGKAKARENLEAIKKDGLSFELSDFKDTGGRVVYSYKVIIGGNAVETGTGGLTIVKDGKIIFDGTVDTEKQLPTTGADLNVNSLWWLAVVGAAAIVLGGFVLKRTVRA